MIMKEKKLTDDEIVKAYKCCLIDRADCDTCPCDDWGCGVDGSDILNLIHRLQSENEEIPCDFAKNFAEELYNAGYRKIPENAVVLTREEYEDIVFSHKFITDLISSHRESVHKEPAELFAERLKELVADRNCNDDYDWEDVQVDGQIFVECVDEIAKEIGGE